MGTKRMPGLIKRGNTWHINKKVDGVRICESTGTGELKEAEKYLVRRLETHRQAKVYGVRPKRSFREAATKFLLENQQKRSLRTDASRLKLLDQYIGDLPLDSVHMGALETFIEARKKAGVKMRTINHALQLTGHILRLAATEWMDKQYGLTWLHVAPKMTSLRETDTRSAYPLEWEEQERLFAELPEYLREMALFTVNTGCRVQEVCQLRWSWQVDVPIPEIGFVFIIPKGYVKNGYRKNADDRLVVLNSVARTIVDRQRGKHPEFVFTYQNHRLSRILNTSWKKARDKIRLNVRVHDLRHTFGARLRAAGVSFEDRQDLLGHRSKRITTHYSRAGLMNLWKAAEKVCDVEERHNLILLRTPKLQGRAKVAQGVFLS